MPRVVILNVVVQNVVAPLSKDDDFKPKSSLLKADYHAVHNAISGSGNLKKRY